MTQPIDVARQVALRNCFRLPPAQTMVARTSTLTNAFVSALIPNILPTVEEIDEALTILGLDPLDLRCAYCGRPHNTWDHLRPLVKNRRPTGFITEIANLVPACNPCNSSKGGSDWNSWMHGKAKGSPTSRKVTDLDLRSKRIEAFVAWKTPTCVDFAAILREDEWNHYWSLRDRAIDDLRAAQSVADRMKERVNQFICDLHGR